MPVGLGQLGQHGLEQPQVAEVLAVGGGVLADQHQLADAAGRPASRPRQQLGRAPGDEGAAEGGDGAERAAAVAAGGDLQRRGHAAREPPADHRRAGGGRDARREVGEVDLAVRLAGWLAARRAHRQQRAAVPGHVRGPLAPGQHVVEPGGDVGVVVEAEHLGFAGSLVGRARCRSARPGSPRRRPWHRSRPPRCSSSMDSCLAAWMKPHVLTRTTSASSPSPRSVQPPAARRAASSSESTSLRAQPRVTRLTVRELDTRRGYVIAHGLPVTGQASRRP